MNEINLDACLFWGTTKYTKDTKKKETGNRSTGGRQNREKENGKRTTKYTNST